MPVCHSHEDCIKRAFCDAESICQSKGLRFTDLRRKVFGMIWESHKPIKAYDILDRLKGGDYSAKPPTVYRTLDFLIEHGLIHKLDSLNAYIGCSHPLKHGQSYFLICSECHEITEYCDSVLDDAIAEATDKNKFNPQRTTLEIIGKCSDCMQKE